MNIHNISMRAMPIYIGNPDYIIIDMREKEDYKKGHVPTAINVEPELLLDLCGKKYCGKIMVLYCDRGSYSLLMARELQKAGVKVLNVVGGYINYQGSVEY